MKHKNRLVNLAFILLAFMLMSSCSMVNYEKNPVMVLEAYFDALNAKDFEKALDIDLEVTNRSLSLESLKGLDASYSDLRILPYTSPNYEIPKDDRGDIPGICERYVVTGQVDYPSGFGVGPSGEFSFLYTMINQEGKWLIFESGTFTKDSCQRATQMLEKRNSE